jgi:hypothetical protein
LRDLGESAGCQEALDGPQVNGCAAGCHGQWHTPRGGRTRAKLRKGPERASDSGPPHLPMRAAGGESPTPMVVIDALRPACAARQSQPPTRRASSHKRRPHTPRYCKTPTPNGMKQTVRAPSRRLRRAGPSTPPPAAAPRHPPPAWPQSWPPPAALRGCTARHAPGARGANHNRFMCGGRRVEARPWVGV